MKTYDEMSVRELLHALAGSLRTSTRLTAIILQRSWREIFWVFLTLVATALCLATLAGFLELQDTPGRLAKWSAWGAELSSHFRLQYAGVLVILTVAFLIRRNFLRALGAAIFALANLAVVAPFMLAQLPPLGGAGAVQALLLNVGNNNRAEQAVIDLVRSSDADIVLLLETGIARVGQFQPLEDDYAYSTYSPGRESYDGALLLSKYPFTADTVRSSEARSQNYLVATIELGSVDLTLLGVQTRAPLRPGRSSTLYAQLQEMARLVGEQDGPTLLMGDLNTTPWAPTFRRFLENSGMQDGRSGFGLQATWPTFLPPLAIPIDHALASPGITVQDFRVGPNVGSDHYPLLLEFTIDALAGEAPAAR